MRSRGGDTRRRDAPRASRDPDAAAAWLALLSVRGVARCLPLLDGENDDSGRVTIDAPSRQRPPKVQVANAPPRLRYEGSRKDRLSFECERCGQKRTKTLTRTGTF